MRLIDADALKREWHMGEKCEECEQDARQCQNNVDFSRMDICAILDDAPTVDLPDALRAAGWKEEGWISVKDKMPKMDHEVLVYAVGKIDGFIGDSAYAICKRFIQHILPSSPGHEVWNTPWQYFHTDFEITHWMPLPEPPKEEDEDVQGDPDR